MYSSAATEPPPSELNARGTSRSESTRTAPAAPAPARGLRMSGYPTRKANSSTSSTEAAPVDWAQGTPPSASTCFIAGLSRQRNAVWVDVPGIPAASRTRAAAMMCASTTASSLSTCA